MKKFVENLQKRASKVILTQNNNQGEVLLSKEQKQALDLSINAILKREVG